MDVFNSRQMQEIDRITIEEEKVSSLFLMENSATQVVKKIFENFGHKEIKSTLIISGKGNNGGDGICVGRILEKLNFFPKLFIASKIDELSKDAKFQVERYGGELFVLNDEKEFLEKLSEETKKSKLIVDALLGTGTKGKVQGVYEKIVDIVNGSGNKVVSIDIPSGLAGDSFYPLGKAIKADLTVTLGGLKLPLVSYECETFCGKVIKVDIGLSERAFKKVKPFCQLIDFDFARQFFQERKKSTHKGDLGHLLVIAGGRGKIGAAVLAAKGALRSGAGLVTVATVSSCAPFITTSIPEAMTIFLPETREGTIALSSFDYLIEKIDNFDAVAIGPGISTHSETSEFSRKIYKYVEKPMVVDADAINCFEKSPYLLKEHNGERILTPHPGEFGRILKVSPKEVVEKRYSLSTQYSCDWGITILLKGYKSLISDSKGFLRINSSGGPYLASAGMGDVLSGIIGSLLARGMNPFDSASIGAFLHGFSAELLFKKKGYGILASEVADNITYAESILRNGI